MQIVSCHDGKLLKVDTNDFGAPAARQSFSTGLEVIDSLLPGKKLARGVIHEVLWEGKNPRPLFFSAWLGLCAMNRSSRIIWSDPRQEIYPPALAGLGISLSQLFLLRPRTSEEELWALAECMGCKGVAVTLAQPPVLSRIVARRLQLVAERGGGIGILMRQRGAGSVHHAAATRWLVEPARGERTVQRWKIQLIHGHGGRLHQPVYLEYSRDRNEKNRVRAFEQLACRSDEEKSDARADALRKRSG
jgi:protein ImuA